VPCQSIHEVADLQRIKSEVRSGAEATRPNELQAVGTKEGRGEVVKYGQGAIFAGEVKLSRCNLRWQLQHKAKASMNVDGTRYELQRILFAHRFFLAFSLKKASRMLQSEIM
jgi:hypothetical protein